ncbi:peptidoglycan DD-metalloendopeptidase family protein [Hazenella sp. IB182353]|uniref:murein hydrolase activator EnvC family protein n=1 Tax=Polycladospora coralii TaxID=2771432 RepID=UPI0017467B33|nr:M23 family metallopeptidase [Polycladospora coralii]MBS7530711.1 peptidoglycan DD-metalloendopeptidase family protein [Polycladospora coralii]
MLKKILGTMLVISLILVSQDHFVLATNDEEKLKETQEQKKEVKQDIKEITAKLESERKELEKVQKEIHEIDKRLSQMNRDLSKNKETIEKKQKKFKEIVKKMYLSGNMQYTNVLLQSTSIDDFFKRFQNVRSLMKNRRRVIDEYVDAARKLESNIKNVEAEKKKLEPLLKKENEEVKKNKALYDKHKKELSKLETHEKITKAKIAEKNRAVARASSGTNYGTGVLKWPTAGGTLTSPFGWRNGRPHEGIDIGNYQGAPIYAADAGTVVLTKSNPGGYGYYVVIDHGNGRKTLYAHMWSYQVKVSVGDRVSKGQRIASVGNNGQSSGPHLHFEVLENGVPKNPMSYVR